MAAGIRESPGGLLGRYARAVPDIGSTDICLATTSNRVTGILGEKCIKQVDEIIDVMTDLRPSYELCFNFDWSSCHDKMPTGSCSKGNLKKDFLTGPGYTSQYHKPGSVENPDKDAAPKLKLFSSVDQVY
jgi:hypothetical protein